MSDIAHMPLAFCTPDCISLWVHECESKLREDSSWKNQVEPPLAQTADQSVILDRRPTDACQITRYIQW